MAGGLTSELITVIYRSFIVNNEEDITKKWKLVAIFLAMLIDYIILVDMLYYSWHKTTLNRDESSVHSPKWLRDKKCKKIKKIITIFHTW